MQLKGLLNYFKLCLLIVVCTADIDDGNALDADAVADDIPDDADAVNDEAPNDTVIDDANTLDADAVADDIPDDAATVKDETPDDADIRDDAVEDDVQVQDNDINTSGNYKEMDNADANAIDDDKKENEDQVDEHVEDKESKNTAVQENNGKNHKNKNIRAAFKLSAAEIKKFKLWTDAKVPYFIDELSYDKVLRDKIRKYLDHANDLLDIDFQEILEPPTDDNERWVFFVNRRGQLDCKDYSHKSFTNNGVQKVVVGYNCLQHGGPIAEIVLALLGVPPVHNSPDRDRYITIHEKHILPDKLGLFKRLTNDQWLFHDLGYDYDSVAHYPLHKYTADGSFTITVNETERAKQINQVPELMDPTALETITRRVLVDGEAADYSADDVQKVTLLYGNFRFKKAKKGLKLEDCKGLYRSRPGLSNTRPQQLVPPPEKPKPKQYLNAVKKLFGVKDIKGETLSELEDD